jgi:predicted glycosyltransferase
MNIWLDISNSPHINLFAELIRDLGRSHELIITARPLANTVQLLELHGIAHTVVGRHYGAARLAKAYGYPVRVCQLWSFLKGKAIDVAISQSSFHSPVVARLLGVRSIYMNDNEHALGNVPAFLAASTILVPECLSARSLRRQLAWPRKVVRYPGVKEGIYLERLEQALRAADERRRSKPRPSVYVRPEPWSAQYYKAEVNFLDEVVLGLKRSAAVSVLPRDRRQASHYAEPRFQGIRVVAGALDIAEIAPDCDLFIGAGGTMTREMAVLGVPTISVYREKLLDVDRYLLARGSLVHRPALGAAEALQYLEHSSRRPANRELLEKGRLARELIKSAILNGHARRDLQ